MRALIVASRIVVIAGLAAACGCAHQKDASAAKPRRFGAAITLQEPVALAALAADPARFVGQTVRIEGTVNAVCQGMGCWAEVTADGSTILAKSLDDGVLIPKDCAGRRIAVQGKVTALGGSEGAEHAEHADGETAEGHVCPRPEYVVSMEAVELR
jgi:hypothetical protein